MDHTTSNSMHCGTNFGMSMRNWSSRGTLVKAFFPRASVLAEVEFPSMKPAVVLVPLLSSDESSPKTLAKGSVVHPFFGGQICVRCGQTLPSAGLK